MDAQQLSRVVHVRDFIKSGSARTLRLSRGVSVAVLAQAVGVSAVSIWRYENGQRTPRTQHALALADTYAALGWEG